jgi:hypothetical protein
VFDGRSVNCPDEQPAYPFEECSETNNGNTITTTFLCPCNYNQSPNPSLTPTESPNETPTESLTESQTDTPNPTPSTTPAICEDDETKEFCGLNGDTDVCCEPGFCCGENLNRTCCTPGFNRCCQNECLDINQCCLDECADDECCENNRCAVKICADYEDLGPASCPDGLFQGDPNESDRPDPTKCYDFVDGEFVVSFDVTYSCPDGFVPNTNIPGLPPDIPGLCERNLKILDREKCECVCPESSYNNPNRSCKPGQFFIEENCLCTCPNGQVFSNFLNRCTDPISYDCINGVCIGRDDPDGAYGSLNGCREQCSGGPPCFPVPTPPIGSSILCNSGKQIGLISYTFNTTSCSWSPIELIWGTCPDPDIPDPDPPIDEDSESEKCDCQKAIDEANEWEYELVCGYILPVQWGGGMNDGPGGCTAYKQKFEWCETCINGYPQFKRADMFFFNTETCEFEESPTNQFSPDFPCPEDSDSDSKSDSSNDSAGDSKSDSASDSASDSKSDSSSDSASDSKSDSASDSASDSKSDSSSDSASDSKSDSSSDSASDSKSDSSSDSVSDSESDSSSDSASDSASDSKSDSSSDSASDSKSDSSSDSTSDSKSDSSSDSASDSKSDSSSDSVSDSESDSSSDSDGESDSDSDGESDSFSDSDSISDSYSDSEHYGINMVYKIIP